ncbi:amidinotransferase [Porphyromonas gingivalis]|nr:amidinotransferase [Porphyromonas gingivalis]
MNEQSSRRVLMIEPVAFRFNPETAANNYFQKETAQEDSQTLALSEFRNMVEILRSKKIEVEVIQDTLEPHTPDSIFPNNWISFHEDGTVVTYPMFAVNRRAERREEIIQCLQERGLLVKRRIDYSEAEVVQIFLEGTGSMVLDRKHQRAYACLSARTNKELFLRFCNDLGYKPICFDAVHPVGEAMLPIYHTNVMMAIGTAYAVICLESITNLEQRTRVVQELETTGHEIVEISFEQMNQFAGNMLEVKAKDGRLYLCMSQSAYDALSVEYRIRLAKHATLLSVPIPTIETLGGGSVRCMMTELFAF